VSEVADAFSVRWCKLKKPWPLQVVTLALQFCDVCTKCRIDGMKPPFVIQTDDAPPLVLTYRCAALAG